MQTVIKAKGLVDVEQGRLMPDPFVIIEGDKVTAIGNRNNMPALSPEAAILDFEDRYILPGLINNHAHLCAGSGGRSLIDSMQEDYDISVLTAARNMRAELMSGVTTVRDCGSPKGVMFGVRKAVERGLIDGPRLFLSGQPLTMTGGHCYYFAHEVDGPQGMVEAVRLRCKEGADFIKIMATGGGTPGTYPWYASYSAAEIAAAVETAHRVGKKVAAHCRGTPGIRNVIAGGIDHIEHASFEVPDGSLRYEPRLADEIAGKGIYVTPTIQLHRDTLRAFRRKKADGSITPLEEGRLAGIPAALEEKMKAMGGFLSAGVKCVAGNDAGLPFTGFGCLWQELEAMVEGGMTPTQAVISATKTGAEALGLADTIGAIAVGKQADLIVVDEDPTVDITALAKVSLVMLGGRVYGP